MTFQVRWDERALAFLRKLDAPVSRRIAEKVDGIKSDPKRYLEPLTAVGAHKLRVGDYRLLIDVDWAGKIIFVRLVGHRKNIYKKV